MWPSLFPDPVVVVRELALRRRLYNYRLLLGPAYLARTRTGNFQSSLVNAVEELEAYLGYYIP